MDTLPKQMRYQAALLPDGGFPRGSATSPQAEGGTKRNRTARYGTPTTHNAAHYAQRGFWYA